MLLGGECVCLCGCVLRMKGGTLIVAWRDQDTGYGISLWPLFNREEFWT